METSLATQQVETSTLKAEIAQTPKQITTIGEIHLKPLNLFLIAVSITARQSQKRSYEIIAQNNHGNRNPGDTEKLCKI